MPVLEIERKALSEAIKYELDGRYTRDVITVIAGQAAITEPRTVLGKITASGKYALLNPGASDGRQVAAGISILECDATLADDLSVALVRGPAIINANALVWPAGITDPQKATALTQLLAIGIKAGVGV